ncbi:MAG TPA: hypothetical protein PKC58_10060 [Ignavibacteria bacterium]|nr:hypothetical protein [Ignavibacteria bacterium]
MITGPKTNMWKPLPLAARDYNARDLSNAFNLTEPRQPWDWPETTPQYVPPNPEATGPFSPSVSQMPLTPPALALHGMLAEKFSVKDELKPKTIGEANDILQ